MLLALLLTVAGWRADIDQAEKQIAATHPNPYRRVSRETLHASFDTLRHDLPSLTDDEAAVRLMQSVALIRDGHTGVFPGPQSTFDRWFPVRFYEFTDGVFITASPSLIGAEVLRIGSVDAAEAMRRAKSAFASDNEFGAKEASVLLSNVDIDRGLHVIDSDDSLRLELRLRDGTTQKIDLPAVRTKSGFEWRFFGEMFGPPGIELPTRNRMDPDTNPDLPLHLRGRRAYWFTYLEERRALYVQINAMANKSSHTPETFAAFVDRVFVFADSHPIDKFILDLRYNSGGNGGLINSVVHEIIKRDRTFGRPGHLFTLVGRKTFSAGLGLVIALRDHTSTMFIGEPAGAALNAFGDADVVTLTNSKFALSISTNYFVGSRFTDQSWMMPVHLPAQFSSADYFGGRDPAVDAILSDNAAMILDVLETNGSDAARALYDKRKAAFKDLPWWEPFRRGAMNAMGFRLLEAGRTPDALAAFEMNVDRFSDSWEAWDSLAEGLMSAKKYSEAIAAYRKALAISPDNWNAAEERKAIAKMERETQ
jgi:hypothetical protein